MKDSKDNQDTPANLERRRFFTTSAKYGFTAALVAGASGVVRAVGAGHSFTPLVARLRAPIS